jgi:YidC/Oxa1 family membrane protein insertase
MDFLINIFRAALYQPLLNVLVLLYLYLPGHDFGVAVIILTLAIRFLVYPLSKKAIKSQKALSALQPKMKEIQEKYKDNKEEQSKKLMELYKKEKINPFSGCLPIIIQLPILIALYRVFWTGLKEQQADLLYRFVHLPQAIDPHFLGLVDLSEPNTVIAVLAGIFQFFQTRMMKTKMPQQSSSKNGNFGEIFQKQAQFIFPVFAFIILLRLPSAIGLYWITTSLFTIGQQYFIFKDKENVRG